MMQIITCEMCGSNDLIKKDGVFVCQHCGCKYSLEEAKKLIVDGPVEVTGTVSIKRDNLEHIKKLGDEAYDRGDGEEAYKYYTEVVEADPSDYERKFKRMIASASNFTINKRSVLNGPISHLPEYISAVENDSELSDDAKEDKIVLACSLVASQVVSLYNLIISIYLEGDQKFTNSTYNDFLNLTKEVLDLQQPMLSYEISLSEKYKGLNDNIILTMNNMVTELMAFTKKYGDAVNAGISHFISESTAQWSYDLAEYILNERKKIEPEYKLPSRLVSPSKGGIGAEKGCYIATCVYGSYDCPEVWTLRRYRDYCLDSSWYGRLFIKCYYSISPRIVKWFGYTKWFNKIGRRKLDKFVDYLNKQGYSNTSYEDKY